MIGHRMTVKKTFSSLTAIDYSLESNGNAKAETGPALPIAICCKNDNAMHKSTGILRPPQKETHTHTLPLDVYTLNGRPRTLVGVVAGRQSGPVRVQAAHHGTGTTVATWQRALVFS